MMYRQLQVVIVTLFLHGCASNLYTEHLSVDLSALNVPSEKYVALVNYSYGGEANINEGIRYVNLFRATQAFDHVVSGESKISAKKSFVININEKTFKETNETLSAEDDPCLNLIMGPICGVAIVGAGAVELLSLGLVPAFNFLIGGTSRNYEFEISIKDNYRDIPEVSRVYKFKKGKSFFALGALVYTENGLSGSNDEVREAMTDIIITRTLASVLSQ